MLCWFVVGGGGGVSGSGKRETLCPLCPSVSSLLLSGHRPTYTKGPTRGSRGQRVPVLESQLFSSQKFCKSADAAIIKNELYTLGVKQIVLKTKVSNAQNSTS